MKNNKRGFTLVEIIGVITILALMLMVSVPALTKSLKQNAQKEYDSYVSNLKMATESYIVKNLSKYPELQVAEGRVYVSLQTLLQEGYIKKIQKDPSATDDRQPDAILVISNADGTFDYQIIKSETLKDIVYQDLRSTLCTETSLSNCYYKSIDSKNFVWYGGFLWRIIGLENDGNIQMITADNVVSLSPNGSEVYNWINDYEYGFKKSLPDYLQNQTFDLLASSQTSLSIEFLTNTGNILVKNGSTEECHLVNDEYSWDKKSCGVRPVMTISGDTKITNGNGSETFPYKLEGESSAVVGTYIANLNVGEYIKIPKKNSTDQYILARVLDNRNNRLKVVLQQSIGSGSWGVISVIQSITTSTCVDYSFLDNREMTWYEGLFAEVSDAPETGAVFVSYYANPDLAPVSEKLNGQLVGILHIGELFATNENNMTNYFIDCGNIACTVRDNSTIYNLGSSASASLRVALYLNPLLKVTGGNGTKESPYTIAY